MKPLQPLRPLLPLSLLRGLCSPGTWILVLALLTLGGAASAQTLVEETTPTTAAPAEGATQAQGIDAVFNDAKIEVVLTVIGNQAGVSVTPYGRATGTRVSVFLRGASLEEVLNGIARPNNLVWWKQEDGSYGIADEQWYRENILPGQTITKIFRPDHVEASELERAIQPSLTQGIGSAVSDDRTNKLIVTDLPQVIERIERLIREIDVQLFTRVFYIRHADVADVATKIENYKSDPGTIEVDEKTHQIIVTDLLANIKKMELLIDILDVGPEIVIYDVNNVGIEGEDLEELAEIIEEIRTPDLLFRVNDDQGVFILEDVPEVHEQVEQILEGFDRPVKQVLLQAEIMQTRFQRRFDFGIDRAVVSFDPFLTKDPSTAFGFRNLTTELPYLRLDGRTISGASLSDYAYLEYSAVFEDTDTKTLLQPRLLVKNQELSRIRVGSDVPYLTTIVDDNGVNNFRSQTQQTVSDGLTFDVTPSIANSYLVELELNIDNSDAETVTRLANGQVNELVQTEEQVLETILSIPSGETRVIGGLIRDGDSQTNSGVPFLVKIPVIGALFGKKTNNVDRFQLQIFITPTVVEDTLPRQIGSDGRRGRLVTQYDRIPGAPAESLDVDSLPTDEELMPGEEESEGLLYSGEGSEDLIESLTRTSTPRVEQDRPEMDTNYTPRATGGTASTGAGSPGRGTSGATGATGGRTTADSPERDPGTDGGRPLPDGSGATGGVIGTTPGGVVATPPPPPPRETRF